MSDELINRLRCGAPATETWHELAARTNRERKEAADYIVDLERECTSLSQLVTIIDAKLVNLERQNAELVRQLAAQSEDVARLDLASIIRRSGYVTSRQANEIADSLRAAMQAGKEPTK